MGDVILVSIQLGLPVSVGVEGAADPDERPWTTGSFKERVAGPVWLGRTNLAGDRQADTVNHSGPDKAVCVYSADHYPAWRRELGMPGFTNGAFGENFTVAGMDEATARIGDTFAVGDVLVQVAQPRVPCWKLARRWGVKDMVERVQSSDRTGWYFRVLEEGYLEAGTPMRLVERPFPQWTISAANRVLYAREDRQGAAELAGCELLASAWRNIMLKRVAGSEAR